MDYGKYIMGKVSGGDQGDPGPMPQGDPANGMGTPQQPDTNPNRWAPSATYTPSADVAPEGTPRADFIDMMKASFIDEPKLKAKFYAKALFPDQPDAIKNFGIAGDGTVVFKAGDGKFYPVNDEDFWGTIKGWSAAAPAAAPEFAGGVVGGIAGTMIGRPIVGSALGSGLGELATQTIGKVAYGDPIDWAKVGVVGAMGGAGEGAGRLVRKAGGALARRYAGGKMGRVAGELADIDPAAMREALDYAQSRGVALNIPQASGSRQLRDVYKYLRDDPRTARIIQDFEAAQNDQAQKAASGFLDEIAQSSETFEVGNRVQKAGQGYRKGLESIREEASRPLYEAAYKEASPVDPYPVTEYVLSARQGYQPGSPVDSVLSRIQKRLTRQEKLPNGSVINVPEDRLENLAHVRQEIDWMLKNDPAASVGKDANRHLLEVRSRLNDQIEKASPTYRAADAAYSEASDPITAFDNTTMGTISRRTADGPIGRSALDIFKSAQDAGGIRKARRVIESQDPEAWQQVLRTNLQDVFDKAAKPLQSGESGNLGGKISQALWGNTATRNKLKAAMTPDQFENLRLFTDMMRRLGSTFGKESATASRLQMEEMVTRAATGMSRRAAAGAFTPLETMKNAAGGFLLDFKRGRYKAQLAEAMLDPANLPKLQALKTLKDPLKFSESALTLLGIWAGKNYYEDAKLLYDGAIGGGYGAIAGERSNPKAQGQAQGQVK